MISSLAVIIRFSGKHDNIVTRVLSAPGLWVQRITTREPTEDMLEVAIISLKCALRDEVPEFMDFFNEKPWLKSIDESEDGNSASCAVGEVASESTAPEQATEDSVTEAFSEKCDDLASGEGKSQAAEEICNTASVGDGENDSD